MFIQSLMGLKNLYDAKLVSIYIMGKPADGDLKRPFKAGGGMFGGKHNVLLPRTAYLICYAAAAEPQTDKAAIEEAEKRIGKKDE